MKNYRTGFLLALFGNFVFIGALAGLWWHSRAAAPAPRGGSMPPGVAMPESAANSTTATPAPAETPLVPVQISPQRLQSIGVKTGVVVWKNVANEIRVTGNVAVDERRLSYVQVRFSGYIQKVFVDATYQYVHKGQPLFTIYSPELVATEREYLVAKQNQQRMSQSTIPGVADGAASLLVAASERLKQWGVPQQEIDRLESSGQVQQELEIDSPVSGFITERNALPSVAVQPEMRLFTLAELSTVWVQAQVFQNDLGRIHPGDSAELTVDTFPGRTFHGRVDFIYPQVDMDTRTARVRIVFSNPGLELKPGMFVNAALKVPMGRQLVIPASGVLQSGARQIVFVYRGDGYLEPREVQLGASAGDDVVVLKGLKSGEQIITSANFLIDSESQLQAALGAYVPPPPGAGVAAAVNTPQASVELTTEPNPPRKGSNTIRVKLTDASGATISGAQVSATFFIGAMPQMGMAAMRVPVTFTDKGNGAYEGSVQLESSGTWQVTILAQQNGKTIASRQMSINAEGGK